MDIGEVPANPNATYINITERETPFDKRPRDSDLIQKPDGFFLGPCCALPPSFLKISLLGFVQFCLVKQKQTHGTQTQSNHIKAITSLLQVTK